MTAPHAERRTTPPAPAVGAPPATKPVKPAPPARWMGGKSKTYAAYIAGELPPHTVYVENFGGMAGVLMAKHPAPVEIYNDLNGALVNLFRVIRDPDQCQRLLDLLAFTPYSRDEWRYCRDNWRAQADQVEKARQVFTLLNQSFVGKLKDPGWSFGRLSMPGRKDRGMGHIFQKTIENIWLVRDRLAEVVIENQPAMTLLERYNQPHTLFYLDPPYLPETRSRLDVYEDQEMTFEDHQALLEQCNQSRAAIVISGYPSQLYDQLLADWKKLEVKAQAASAVHSARNGLKHAPQSVQVRIECLWFNPRAWSLKHHRTTRPAPAAKPPQPIRTLWD